MNIKTNNDCLNRGSKVRKFLATVLGGIRHASRTNGNEPPHIDWPLGTSECDEPALKQWIGVVDGLFVDQLNRRPTGTVTGEVDIAELGRFLDASGAIKKYFVSGAVSTVDGSSLTKAGFKVWHQPPLRPSARRMPGETAVVEGIKSRFAVVTLRNADGLIIVANGDDKGPVLQEALDRELNVMLISRWDILTPKLKALLKHPLASFADIRADVGAA